MTDHNPAPDQTPSGAYTQIAATSLPQVLKFPGTPQNSISVLRALKNIKEVLEGSLPLPEDDDRYNAALDDLDLMIGAVK